MDDDDAVEPADKGVGYVIQQLLDLFPVDDDLTNRIDALIAILASLRDRAAKAAELRGPYLQALAHVQADAKAWRAAIKAGKPKPDGMPLRAKRYDRARAAYGDHGLDARAIASVVTRLAEALKPPKMTDPERRQMLLTQLAENALVVETEPGVGSSVSVVADEFLEDLAGWWPEMAQAHSNKATRAALEEALKARANARPGRPRKGAGRRAENADGIPAPVLAWLKHLGMKVSGNTIRSFQKRSRRG